MLANSYSNHLHWANQPAIWIIITNKSKRRNDLFLLLFEFAREISHRFFMDSKLQPSYHFQCLFHSSITTWGHKIIHFIKFITTSTSSFLRLLTRKSNECISFPSHFSFALMHVGNNFYISNRWSRYLPSFLILKILPLQKNKNKYIYIYIHTTYNANKLFSSTREDLASNTKHLILSLTVSCSVE